VTLERKRERVKDREREIYRKREGERSRWLWWGVGIYISGDFGGWHVEKKTVGFAYGKCEKFISFLIVRRRFSFSFFFISPFTIQLETELK